MSYIDFLKSNNFISKSYIVNLQNSEYNEEETILMNYEKGGKWVWKPAENYGGRGIKIF